MSFDQFAIDPVCLRLLGSQGITDPTPIQAQAIPVAVAGRDVIAIAQTGTGKTLAFSLPTLTRIARNHPHRDKMLVLTPTRELAVQVHSVIEPFAKALKLHAACVYGGVGYGRQIDALRRDCPIVVATPGRLLDHLAQGNIHLNHFSILVLDEADRMLDMGFLPDIRRIVGKFPKERQTLMFSATFPPEIARLASDMQRDAVRIEVGAVAKPVESVRQAVYTVDQSAKVGLLSKLLQASEVRSALVFSRTKHRTDRVAKTLHRAGFKVQAIHGGRTQSQRQQALNGFRQGRYDILVATDIAARGLDIQGVSHVINFDIPKTSEEYIHRIGRTARANADGDAITFVSPDESVALRAIESALGKNLPRAEWEGAVPVLQLYHPEGERTEKRGPSRRSRSLFRRR